MLIANPPLRFRRVRDKRSSGHVNHIMVHKAFELWCAREELSEKLKDETSQLNDAEFAAFIEMKGGNESSS